MKIPEDVHTYEELKGRFRWEIPERFNIAEVCCERHARATPRARAVIEDRGAEGSRTYTFAELKERTDRVAHGLLRLGIGREDRVAVVSDQGMTPLTVYLACLKLGVIGVPIAPQYGTEALVYRLEDSGAKVLVTDAAGVAKLDAHGPRPVSLEHVVTLDDTGGEGRLALSELTSYGAEELACADTGCDDPALLFYTSGTTGPAKGALHGHRFLTAVLPGVQMFFDLAPKEGDVFWTPSVWSWMGSLGEVVLPSLLFGCPVVASRGRFSVPNSYRILSEHKVTCPFLAATVLRRMRVESPGPETPMAVRAIGTGGEVVAPELIQWARETFGAAVNEVFGTTEAVHIAVACEALYETPYGAMGLPIPGREIAILDPEGRPVPPGTSGEIVVDANDPVVMLGYWNQPEKTAEKFAGGWAHTHDAGVIDSEGFLRFQGRQDDLILTAGHRVGPDEVECHLLTHEAVLEACVVGLPDENLGQRVAAFVRLREGLVPTPKLADELRAFVKSRLAAHAYPRVVEFVDSFPVTTTGKILRGQLRREYLEKTGR